MKQILIFLLVIIFTSCGSVDDILPGDTYIKFYGDDATYELRDMIFSKTSGGEVNGIVLFGTREGNNDGIVVSNFFIVHTDLDGNELKRMEYRIPQSKLVGSELQEFEYNTEASRIKAIENGYLIIGTYYNSDPNDEEGTIYQQAIWADLSTDFALNGDWQYIGDGATETYFGKDINETSDGGRIVAGYTDANGTNDLFYSKIGGAAEWSRIQTRLASDDQLVSAWPLGNDAFVLIGQTDAPSDDGEGGINVERTIIDGDGVITNSQIYGITSSSTDRDDKPSRVIVKAGGYAIVGTSTEGNSSKPFLMLVDLNGAISDEVLYEDEFSSPDLNAGAFGITQTKTNDYFIIGTIQDFKVDKEEKGNELFVMTLDQDGTSKGAWKNFGLINGNESAVRVLTDPEGSLIVGATYDFGGQQTRFALLKMNTDGELKK